MFVEQLSCETVTLLNFASFFVVKKCFLLEVVLVCLCCGALKFLWSTVLLFAAVFPVSAPIPTRISHFLSHVYWDFDLSLEYFHDKIHFRAQLVASCFWGVCDQSSASLFYRDKRVCWSHEIGRVSRDSDPLASNFHQNSFRETHFLQNPTEYSHFREKIIRFPSDTNWKFLVVKSIHILPESKVIEFTTKRLPNRILAADLHSIFFPSVAVKHGPTREVNVQ